MITRLYKSLISALLALPIGAIAGVAHADDGEVKGGYVGAAAMAHLTSTAKTFEGGPGLRLEGGYAIPVKPVFIAPELVVDIDGLFGDATLLDFHAMGGVKVGVDVGARIFGMTHVGYGLLHASSIGTNFNAVSFDVGGGVDKEIVKHLTIGGVLGYRGVIAPADDVSSHGVELGFRANYWF